MITPLVYKDFYKTDHRRQYPMGTEYVYSNMTARGSRMPEIDKIVVFGIQYFVKEYLIKQFNDNFFKQPIEDAVRVYKRRLDTALGPNAVPVDHIYDLHKLGYLPIEIKALKEGTQCPMRVAFLTIKNTNPRFYWLTNFFETILSTTLWGPITSATIANAYRKVLDKYAAETSDNPGFVQWQGHDFSMRGMFGLEAAMMSGAGHLLSFTGTDTIPAIDFLEKYYNANAEKELIGGSVYATEHSVMCLGGDQTELETYKRIVTQVYPTGIVSIVSDTWDYWNVLTAILPTLKTEILAREGKVVIRPDSGDPVKIICGDDNAPVGTPEYKGSIELLWETFGGTVNTKGYKELNPKIGLIYGDSITLERCKAICEGLKKKGFASTNVVYGIGSYTYQHQTRDVFGLAVKATWGMVNGVAKNIFKDPKTDTGIKKSAKGLLHITEKLEMLEEVTPEMEQAGMLRTVFKNGELYEEQTLQEIRNNIKKA